MTPGGPSQEPEGAETARVRCLYCGANNFPNSPTCWQCKHPLRAARTSPSATPQSPAPSIGTGPRAPETPPLFAAGASIHPPAVNPALAGQAAAALGLMFPYVGLPAGMLFLMLEDPHKVSLGWKLIGWSLAGTAINVIALLATLGPLLAVLKGLLPSSGHGAGGGIPGVPDLSGGADGAVFLPLHYHL